MPDAVLIDAVDIARDAAIELADDASAVGDYLGATEEHERTVTHSFACLLPGYRGWVWTVTLSRAPRGKDVGVDEAQLTPAADALLAPAWVPWAERVEPGDLEASMVLPLIENDARLVPTYEVTQDEDAMQIWELGLGRERVLGSEGREDVATRWYRGSHGPTAASAIASAEPCQTCAFYVPLSGAMRLMFGACTNEWSPSDGKIVSVDHGCGAHSQTTVEHGPTQWPAADPVFSSDAVVPFDLGMPDAGVESEHVADDEPVAEAEPEVEAQPEAEPEPTTDEVQPDA